jgi:hypothetical protein
MFYGYEQETGRGYVRRMWTTEPDADQRVDTRVVDGEERATELAVLEVDHPEAPTEGFFRVSDGQLVECPGPEEECERRRERMKAAKARRAAELRDRMVRAEPGRRA